MFGSVLPTLETQLNLLASRFNLARSIQIIEAIVAILAKMENFLCVSNSLCNFDFKNK